MVGEGVEPGFIEKVLAGHGAVVAHAGVGGVKEIFGQGVALVVEEVAGSAIVLGLTPGELLVTVEGAGGNVRAARRCG